MYQKKWEPPTGYPNILQNTKPLIDNTHTPRSRERAITLDRNYSHKKWVPPSTSLAEFRPKKKSRFGRSHY
jgi:hypothetical protein